MQQDEPDDYILSTGVSHSIREFLDIAFDSIDIDNWEQFVTQDPRFFRPAEVDVLRGDATKAKEILGWEPKTRFNELVRKMVANDLKKIGESL
jgi:GDPmannose 4,6-dehydratase